MTIQMNVLKVAKMYVIHTDFPVPECSGHFRTVELVIEGEDGARLATVCMYTGPNQIGVEDAFMAAQVAQCYTSSPPLSGHEAHPNIPRQDRTMNPGEPG
jgi:hypothetical protein